LFAFLKSALYSFLRFIGDERTTLVLTGFMVLPLGSGSRHNMAFQILTALIWVVLAVIAWRRLGRRLKAAES
jgi:hypothetical protein